MVTSGAADEFPANVTLFAVLMIMRSTKKSRKIDQAGLKPRLRWNVKVSLLRYLRNKLWKGEVQIRCR